MSSLRGAIDPIPKLFQGTWEGENKIVVGIDIGTTQSGVAFAFLEKGQDQAIQRVTHWPGQEAQSLASKIPTLVWYNTDKEAVSFGAEALSPQAEEEAEDNEWQLARHFKLHLHPGSMRNEHGLALDPLPPGVSLLRVYSDFLGYLIRHTQTFFEDRIIDGRLIWQKHRPSMQFIIAHPNGWGIREQAFLRTAATNAGLVTNATAATCIRFVTEAEASVHFCIYHTNLGSRLKPGMKFAVCDAGGSTVDTTVYSVISTRVPIELEEAHASACVQAGAIFVNAAAEQHIQRTLTSANLPSEDVADYSKRGIQDFEKNLKRQFAGSADSKTVEVAGTRTNYPAIGIRRGHMSLSGERVQKFFDICVNEIKSSVDQQIQGLNISHILLVGGFGDSPYLRRVFKDRYEPQGCQITLTNDSTSKAVADGAIIWSTTSNVTGRAPRSSFGIETSMRYNSGNVDHQGREVITCPSGNQKVSGIWSQIAAKGVTIDARAVARESFSQAFSSPNPDLSNFEVSLISYANNGEPMWARDKRGVFANGFQNCCTISADLTNLSGALEPRIGVHGNKYWRLYFEVCIRFGGTELEAYLEWEERGATRTSDVTIVPDDPVEDQKVTKPVATREKITSEELDVILSQEASAPVLILGRFNTPREDFIYTASEHMGIGPESDIRNSAISIQKTVINGHPFNLINTPGFDDPHKGNLEVFVDIARYLLSEELKSGVKGIVYVHCATDSLQSRSLIENLNVLFNILLGQPALRILTVLVVPPSSKGVEDAHAVATDMQNSDSAFSAAQKAEARIMASVLDDVDVFDVLNNFMKNDLVQLKIQRDRPVNIRHTIEQALGYCDISSVSASLTRQKEETTQEYRPSLVATKRELEVTRTTLEHARRLLAETQEKAERYQAGYRQLEVQIGGEQKRSQDLARKLQDTQAEYSSLRSQLQLQENTEQSEIVLGLKDINRAIEDIGRAFSAHFTDRHANAAFNKDPLEVTTLDARDLTALQVAFGHMEGEPSFIKSSDGAGMMVEDFFDYGIRHLLCSFLWQRIFTPFHPRLNDPFDQLLTGIYQNIQRREPQAASGKWRVNTYIGIDSSDHEGLAKGEIIASHATHFCEGIIALAKAFFGQDQDVQLEEAHSSQVHKLMQEAWDWNAQLKGKVVVLGDFYQIRYEPRSPLDPNLMEEFEPRKGVSAEKILGTLGLGLISAQAVGGEQPLETTVVCKATVATESLYS
ncbi:hypothetical protein RhiTH_003955 [Rhizoctonia solani]